VRFASNRFYIEKYVKCANCGVLVYDEGVRASANGRDAIYCSDWCVDWQTRRATQSGFFALPLPAGATPRWQFGDTAEDSDGRTDLVTLKIIEGNLASICRDMGITVMRTAYSPIFSESLDFTCGLFDVNGDMIAVGDFNPSMIGGMPLIIKTVVQEIPVEEIEEGDVLVHNDPYRGGMHTPEHTFFKPIFVEGELMGFAGAIGHVGEIGGMVPGSFFAEATEIFAEGLRVPPVKIRVRGKDNADVWRLLLANVRTPRENHGDYRALMAGVDLGERRAAELIRKYGKDTYRRTTHDLLDYSEARMRAEIRAIPDGKYSFEDYMEDDGIRNEPLKIHVDLYVQGEEIVADFSGTSLQARGPINTPLSIPQAATYNALLQLSDLSLPKNSGCFRPIRVVVPPGTLLNVDYPAPSVGGNTECHPRIVYVVLGALAPAIPEQAPAADGGTWSNFLFGGVNPETGDYITCYDIHTVGWGGRRGADGNDAVGSMNGNCRTIPVEVYETRYPWLVEELTLIADSGGAGQFRGGLGTRKIVRCTGGEITVSHVGDRHKLAPWGLFGGLAGSKASTLIQRAGSRAWQTAIDAFGKVSPSKFANVTIREGDRIRISTPGGGGWGDPARRDRAKLRDDVRDGYVSDGAAERDYKQQD
jgi:N-methylhydantoinase B